MEEAAARSDEIADAVEAYLLASDDALNAAQALKEAWGRHFASNGDEPSLEWIAEVAAKQTAGDLALRQARMAVAVPRSVTAPTPQPAQEKAEPNVVRVKRKRRRESKLLTSIGRPGQRFLRAGLILLLVIATLVATGAGISLSLEIAGFLHLIDDPVQLPVGIQLAIFIVAAALAFALRRLLKPVERALYGSKGVRPKGFQL
jgi:hypothetical protein